MSLNNFLLPEFVDRATTEFTTLTGTNQFCFKSKWASQLGAESEASPGVMSKYANQEPEVRDCV